MRSKETWAQREPVMEMSSNARVIMICRFLRSAKGAARTTVQLRNCFAPRSVLREFLKSEQGPARSVMQLRNTLAPVSVVREFLKSSLLPQREREQRIARGHRHVLPAAHRVGHGAGGDRASDRGLPQQRASAGFQREEVSFAAAAEQKIRSRGQDAG